MAKTEVLSLITETVGFEPDVTRTLEDGGLNSILAVQLSSKILNQYGVTVDPADILTLTPSELAERVQTN